MAVIGVDARPTEASFKAHAGRGTGRYAAELIPRLTRLAAVREDLSLRQIGTADLQMTAVEKKILSALPCGRLTFSSQFLFARAVARQGVQLMHFFAHGDAPACPFVPQVVTVLDLIPLRFPELYRGAKSNLRFRFARRLEYQAIRSASGILAISEATKRDLIELLQVPEEKVIVTHLAAGKHFVSQGETSGEEKEALKKSFGLPASRPVLLYVGGIDPRKNVLFLLSLTHELRKNETVRPVLALAGAYENDDQFPRLQERIEELELKDDVVLLGFVDEARLPSLYRAADLFLFPSLYEGFGLPVLEAMAGGTPVIAGRNSSLPEVGGDAVLFCRDNDLEEWTRETASLLADGPRRAAMTSRARQQAAAFSWERCAEATFSAYERFLARLPLKGGAR